MRNKEWDGDVFWQQKWWSFRIIECGKDGQWIMVCCNMCVVLLYIKMDFVRGMKNIWECEWIIWRLNVARAAAGVVFCVMTLIMLLSKKGRFYMRNKEWDGDVFWVAKMMKFQNNGVWERWAMDYGML